MREADSLGRQVEALGKQASAARLREADRIQQKALDLELTLADHQARCRELAGAALPSCQDRIRELESRIRDGHGTSDDAAALIRLQEARSRLEQALEGPVVLEYPPLAPDSLDTQETLRAKLQYHQDVSGYLQALSLRVGDRLARLTEERRTLVEARRFIQDLNLVDAGGDVSPGGAVRVRGGIAGGGDGEGGNGRTAPSADIAREAGDLEFALGITPTTPEESDRLIRVLDNFRREIQRELEAVSSETREIEQRIVPESPPPR